MSSGAAGNACFGASYGAGKTKASRDPRGAGIYYVGQSTDPEKRLTRHITEARAGRLDNRALCRWLLCMESFGDSS